MPPRYAYWTILIGDEPTAFRSGSQEDLLPTFKRLEEKQPSARMMWFQNGKLWESRLAAQEAMRARGEMGRAGDFKQRRPRPQRFEAEGREPRRSAKREGGDPSGKLAWKPKSSSPQVPKPSWSEKLEWKPKASTSGSPIPDPGSREKRKWVPKEEYQKSKGIEAKRDTKWRPGGEHKDPRQKYKDAKKAKWGRFKQTVRKRWESKPGGKKKNE